MVNQRFFTFLNLSGLAVGTGAFLLIFLYITDELSYDTFHDKADRLYRINMTNIWIESNEVFGSTSPAVSAAVKSDIPEVQNIVRIHAPYSSSGQIVSFQNNLGEHQKFEEEQILAADSTFFEIFTFPFIEGNPQTAFNQPNAMILTRDHANKYFPNQNALGKLISIGTGEDQTSFQVTGVIENIPDQSHFQWDILLSMSSYPKIARRSNSWIWTGFVTYALLDGQSDLAKVNSALAAIPARYVGEEKATQKNWILQAQNIKDIRLYSGSISNRLGPMGNIDNVVIFGSVALMILLLSCINFMNLTTARFASRAKEIAIQKVLGSLKSEIKVQFFLESLLFSFIAVILGFGLAEIVRPFFNQMADKNLSLNLFDSPSIITLMIGLVVVVGLLSGSYPAWFMTKFHMIESLKGKNSPQSGKFNFRNALVVFQFAVSIALISSSFLVKNQLTFLQNQSLGFDDENIIIIPHLEWMDDDGELFAEILEANNILEAPAISNAVPPNAWNQENLTPMGSSKTTDLAVTCMSADNRFLPTLGVALKAGRNFFADGDGDTNNVIINEECAIQMGWLKAGDDPEKVLGKKISYYGDGTFQVVGVMKDFNFWSLNNPIEPLAIFHPKAPMFHGDFRFLSAKVAESDMAAYDKLVIDIESSWSSLNNNLPFQYQFLNQSFDAAFSDQRQFGKVLNSFTFLAILIAVLGLVGLISYTTEQKTKEFGIRKVLGASVQSLMRLIYTDFLKLLLIAMVAGVSVSYYFGSKWLANFAYQGAISPWIYLTASIVILTLILIITAIIILDNARKNPAAVLRDD